MMDDPTDRLVKEIVQRSDREAIRLAEEIKDRVAAQIATRKETWIETAPALKVTEAELESVSVTSTADDTSADQFSFNRERAMKEYEAFKVEPQWHKTISQAASRNLREELRGIRADIRALGRRLDKIEERGVWKDSALIQDVAQQLQDIKNRVKWLEDNAVLK